MDIQLINIGFGNIVSANKVVAIVSPLGVDRLLHKPFSLAALCDCINEVLRATDARTPDRASTAEPSPPSQARPSGALPSPALAASSSPEPPDGSEAAQAHAVAAYFEGDRALFSEMLQRAAAQFRHDALAGDAALAGGDLRALRRTAHSLKTILRMLAYPRAGERARELEQLLAAGEHDRWPQLWTLLRRDILQIADSAR